MDKTLMTETKSMRFEQLTLLRPQDSANEGREPGWAATSWTHAAAPQPQGRALSSAPSLFPHRPARHRVFYIVLLHCSRILRVRFWASIKRTVMVCLCNATSLFLSFFFFFFLSRSFASCKLAQCKAFLPSCGKSWLWRPAPVTEN